MARWIVYNSTGIPDTIINKGRGFVVRVMSSIQCPLPSILPPNIETVPVLIDSWDDSLGLSFITELIFEMTYYNDSVVDVQKSFDINGQGERGTISQGATVTENRIEDSMYTYGKRGYYELNIIGDSTNLGMAGTLINVEFQGIHGLDTSTIVFDLKDFNDTSSQMTAYMYSVSTPGCVTVDSLTHCHSSIGIIPNPFSDATNFQITLPFGGHAKLTINNEAGDVVATVLDANMASGTIVVPFDGSYLPNGYYFYMLETPDGKYTGAMEKMKLK